MQPAALRFGLRAVTLDEAFRKAQDMASAFFGQNVAHEVVFNYGEATENDDYYCAFTANLTDPAKAISQFYPLPLSALKTPVTTPTVLPPYENGPQEYATKVILALDIPD